MGRRHTRSARAALVIAIGTLLFSACGGGNNASGSGGATGGTAGGGGVRLTIADGGDPDPGPADVTILNFRFEPTEHTVSAGSSVVWVNEGSAPHTVTGEGFDSGTIRTSRGFTHTFDEPGEYAYWCKNHPGMDGTITVE